MAFDAATLALSFRRAGTQIAGVDETWTVYVPDTAAAVEHLAIYASFEEEVTATLTTTATGDWLGTGRAGHGTVNYRWEF